MNAKASQFILLPILLSILSVGCEEEYLLDEQLPDELDEKGLSNFNAVSAQQSLAYGILEDVEDTVSLNDFYTYKYDAEEADHPGFDARDTEFITGDIQSILRRVLGVVSN